MDYCRCNPDDDWDEIRKAGEKEYIKEYGGLCENCDGLLQYCEACDQIYCDCKKCKCRRNPSEPPMEQKLFEAKVRRLRAGGMADRFIARQIVDDYYRSTGRLLPQPLVEQLVRQVR